MDNRRWFIRAGPLVVLVAFFLPSLLVSCTAAPGLSQSLSLFDLASKLNQQGLYLVPLGLIVALVLFFVKPNSRSQAVQFLWMQIVAIGIGLLSIVLSLLSLSSQLNRSTGGLFDASGMWKVSPDYGFFVLIAGYVWTAIGLGLQWQDIERSGLAPPPVHTPSPGPAATQPLTRRRVAPPSAERPALASFSAYLEVVQGNLPYRSIPIHKADFAIGRGQWNDLNLPDSTVSRQHARIRYAQGMWFIQDQDSKAGTFVNGQRVQAIRLNSGDQVQIGRAIFIFRF